ncbi:MAG: cell cycle transcriptional regulator TrcR [Pseudomonadota bacterium]|nr:cell cycle transcriptional regulator TrcR [Pseudomonadota bacterium]
MSQPLMPKATAVWLLDNTVLTFEQIADFCNLHLLEVKGIADGDVARGIRGADPIAAGQLTRAEIENCQEDSEKRLKGIEKKVNLPKAERRVGKKYTPLSKRQDRPDAIFWLVRNHPELLDAQISRLIGTTKSTIEAIRDRTHWNSAYLTPVDPVSIGLCTQVDLDKEVKKASKRIENKKKKEEKELLTSTTIDEANESIPAPVNDEVVEEIKEEVIETINEEPEEKKEYDTDSVFAKLQELKKE